MVRVLLCSVSVLRLLVFHSHVCAVGSNSSKNSKSQSSVRDEGSIRQPLYLRRVNGILELVILPEDSTLTLREDGIFELPNKEELILACPGRDNKLLIPSTEKTEWPNERREQNFLTKDLICATTVRSVLVPNFGKSCGGTGNEMTIGFKVGKELVPLITLCHDVKAADTFYVEHDVLAGAGGDGILRKRPEFRRGPEPLYTKIDMKNLYTQEYQRDFFNNLLGRGVGERMIQGSYYLAKSHLAPHADFFYPTWQWATHYYANVAPQWQVINGGNWRGLEEYIRKVAVETAEDLHIITGTYGTLSMQSTVTGLTTSIHLHTEGQERLRVPEGFFKIIRSKRTNKAIVAICSNNPFEVPGFLCKNISEANSWPASKQWSSPAMGQIYFCDVKEFLARVKTVLPRVKYEGILQGIETRLQGPPLRPSARGHAFPDLTPDLAPNPARFRPPNPGPPDPPKKGPTISGRLRDCLLPWRRTRVTNDQQRRSFRLPGFSGRPGMQPLFKI